MHIIDVTKFEEALKKSPYRTIGGLATALGIHRNTIHYYLSGHGVFPEKFEAIFGALGLKAMDIIIEKEASAPPFLEPIAPLIDMLSSEFRDATFILFGSRAKGSAQKYSDWDVGVFSKKGISHEMYRKIVNRKEELVEDCPFFVDVVNLNQADKYFLRESAKYWMFLSGKLSDWVELQKRVKK